MQVNTLNRVISLFLKGGLLVVICAIYFFDGPHDHLRLKNFVQAGGAGSGVFLAVGLLSVTALAGTIVDAVGNLTIRRFVVWAGARRAWARLLFCRDEFDEQERWRCAFIATPEIIERYGRLIDKKEMQKPLSAGLFFQTAQKEHAEWLIQYYSMYNLSADFVGVLLGWAILAFWRGELLGAFACFGLAYLLLTFALDNYFYTYQLSFRNACLAVRNEPVSAEP